MPQGIPMQISSEGKIGILLTLFGLAGAGAMEIAPEKLWIGWSLIGFAVLGSFALGFHHFRGRFVVVLLAAGAMCFDAWYYSNVLNVATLSPRMPPVVPSTRPEPATPKPQLVSTWQKLILICDKPKPAKEPSRKEMQAGLDKFVDVMKKVFGYKAKGTLGDGQEYTVELIPDKPFSNGLISVSKQTYFVKRIDDRIAVTVTSEYSSLSPLFQLDRVAPDPADPAAKTMEDTVEKMLAVEPGKCKFI
jgi:hypothetical protein